MAEVGRQMTRNAVVMARMRVALRSMQRQKSKAAAKDGRVKSSPRLWPRAQQARLVMKKVKTDKSTGIAERACLDGRPASH